MISAPVLSFLVSGCELYQRILPMSPDSRTVAYFAANSVACRLRTKYCTVVIVTDGSAEDKAQADTGARQALARQHVGKAPDRSMRPDAQSRWPGSRKRRIPDAQSYRTDNTPQATQKIARPLIARYVGISFSITVPAVVMLGVDRAGLLVGGHG